MLHEDHQRDRVLQGTGRVMRGAALLGAALLCSSALAEDAPPRQGATDLIPALSPGAASAVRVCEQQRERSERDVLVLAHAHGEADAEVKTLRKQIEMYQTTIKGMEEKQSNTADWWRMYTEGLPRVVRGKP
jgi:hypothetical protein